MDLRLLQSSSEAVPSVTSPLINELMSYLNTIERMPGIMIKNVDEFLNLGDDPMNKNRWYGNRANIQVIYWDKAPNGTRYDFPINAVKYELRRVAMLVHEKSVHDFKLFPHSIFPSEITYVEMEGKEGDQYVRLENNLVFSTLKKLAKLEI